MLRLSSRSESDSVILAWRKEGSRDGKTIRERAFAIHVRVLKNLELTKQTKSPSEESSVFLWHGNENFCLDLFFKQNVSTCTIQYRINLVYFKHSALN